MLPKEPTYFPVFTEMEQVLLEEFFNLTSRILTEPFHYLVSADQRVYWLYLLMAIAN